MSFLMPPWLRNAKGELRKVGFELEYSGPELDEVANLVQSFFGGQVEQPTKFVRKVKQTSLGEFSVESDATFVKRRSYRRFFAAAGLDPESSPLADKLESAAVRGTNAIFPFEVVTPPVPLDRLEEVERLREGLRALGAQGTRASVLSPFGVHLNPEVPGTEAPVLLAYLRAFFLLQDWLIEDSQVDLTRKIAPFIRPFPRRYVELVLDLRYRPDIDMLIDDYLVLTPSRNRPLDMLPLFASLAEKKVRAHAKESEIVKPRPTFHYRLPNCLIDDPQWSLAQEWNRWAAVEQLAADAERIAAMCERYHELRGRAWVKETRKWLGAA